MRCEPGARRSFVVLLALLRDPSPISLRDMRPIMEPATPIHPGDQLHDTNVFFISAAMLAVIATSCGARHAVALDDGWRIAQAAEPQNERRRPPGQRPGQAAPGQQGRPSAPNAAPAQRLQQSPPGAAAPPAQHTPPAAAHAPPGSAARRRPPPHRRLSAFLPAAGGPPCSADPACGRCSAGSANSACRRCAARPAVPPVAQPNRAADAARRCASDGPDAAPSAAAASRSTANASAGGGAGPRPMHRRRPSSRSPRRRAASRCRSCHCPHRPPYRVACVRVRSRPNHPARTGSGAAAAVAPGACPALGVRPGPQQAITPPAQAPGVPAAAVAPGAAPGAWRASGVSRGGQPPASRLGGRRR